MGRGGVHAKCVSRDDTGLVFETPNEKSYLRRFRNGQFIG